MSAEKPVKTPEELLEERDAAESARKAEKRARKQVAKPLTVEQGFHRLKLMFEIIPQTATQAAEILATTIDPSFEMASLLKYRRWRGLKRTTTKIAVWNVRIIGRTWVFIGRDGLLYTISPLGPLILERMSYKQLKKLHKALLAIIDRTDPQYRDWEKDFPPPAEPEESR